MDNYKVAVAKYGHYVHGNVIPAAVPLAYGTDPEQLVALGTLVKTKEPCNCPILADDAVPVSEPTAALVQERNDWQKRAERAERAEQLLMAQVEGLQSTKDAFERSLAKMTAERAILEAKLREVEQQLAAAKHEVAELNELLKLESPKNDKAENVKSAA